MSPRRSVKVTLGNEDVTPVEEESKIGNVKITQVHLEVNDSGWEKINSKRNKNLGALRKFMSRQRKTK